MNQSELVQNLDSFFNSAAFNEESHWRPRLSDRDFHILERFALPEFRNGAWNGLLLDNTERIDRVYTIVFPAQDVIDTIIAREVARGAPGALIFAHHLLTLDQERRRFLLISEDQLEELKEHHISFYLCHAPLDHHPEISTASALANTLGLREQARFAQREGGPFAIHGVVGKPISFQAFAQRLAKLTDVDRLRYDQIRHNGLPVQHVAAVPGNGADPELLEQAIALGCDTYVTGQWWFYGETDYAETQRTRMREMLLGGLRLNLLGVSRYATEMVVMREQMLGWFRAQGVDAEFIPQGDPWA